MRVWAWVVLLALLAPLVGADAAARFGATAEGDDTRAETPWTLVIGFHGRPPADLTYAGSAVVASDPALRFLVVLTHDPAFVLAHAWADPRVRYAEEDGGVRASFWPNDPAFLSGEQYGPSRIGAPAAWNLATGSTGVSLCIVDSGVRLSHEDIAAERHLGGFDFVDRDQIPNDENGHGTFTTALATGRIDNGLGIAGMASVSWRHARVLDAAGQGLASNTAMAIRWCADHGAHVISLSLGRTQESTPIRDAADLAWNAGAILVAASGNGACTDCVQVPARYPSVAAVACTDANDAPCFLTSGGPQIELAAPGLYIRSAGIGSNGDYVTASGTSASTPLVAGAFALLKSFAPALSNVELRTRMVSSALDVGAPGWDARTGLGLLQLDMAMYGGPTPVTISCPSTPATLGRETPCDLRAGATSGNVVFDVAWGDGGTTRVPTTGSVAPGGTTTAAHTWSAAGHYVIRVTTLDAATAMPLTPVTRVHHEVRTCTFERAGQLALGAAGVAIESVSSRTHTGIPSGCGRSAWEFTSNATLAGAFELCWMAGTFSLRCDRSVEGDVPEGASALQVKLLSGADASYQIVIPR